jgi:hypothetical protein
LLKLRKTTLWRITKNPIPIDPETALPGIYSQG